MSCFMIVATACRVDERKFVGFFFWMWFATIWREVMNFSWGRKGICRTQYRPLHYWFSGLWCCLSLRVSLCVWLPNSMDQRIALKFWRIDIYWPIRFVFYYFIFEPKYFLLVHFRSYLSRMFLSMFSFLFFFFCLF